MSRPIDSIASEHALILAPEIQAASPVTKD